MMPVKVTIKCWLREAIKRVACQIVSQDTWWGTEEGLLPFTPEKSESRRVPPRGRPRRVSSRRKAVGRARAYVLRGGRGGTDGSHRDVNGGVGVGGASRERPQRGIGVGRGRLGVKTPSDSDRIGPPAHGSILCERQRHPPQLHLTRLWKHGNSGDLFNIL